MTTVHHITTAPPGAIYIGRAMPGHLRSLWANPHKITADTPQERAAALRAYFGTLHSTGKLYRVAELRNKALACWCAPKLCHGDLLADLADRCTTQGQPCAACQTPQTASLILTNAHALRLRTYCPRCRRTTYSETGPTKNFEQEQKPLDIA